MFEFNISKKNRLTRARSGIFQTPHGKLHTPELAFVATEGEIKSIPKEVLPTLPINLIIVNTFHLWIKKIIQTIDDRKWKVDIEDRELKIEMNQPSILHPQNPLSTISSLSSNNKTIHDYANFQKPIMSDSGGFQVFSLGFGKTHGVGKIASIFPNEKSTLITQKKTDHADKSAESACFDINNPLKITDTGVEFNFNGEKITLTPEKSIILQQQIGADIIFAFDECTSPLNSYEYTKEAMEKTHRWLKRCLTVLEKLKAQSSNVKSNPNVKKSDDLIKNLDFDIDLNLGFRILNLNKQALFGIVQGGYYENLRKKSAKFMSKQDVPGFGIGGSLGRTKEDVLKVLEWTIPILPEEKPRHLLGIGQVRDIFESVERGIDLFDCVIPTREARHKVLYTNRGKINVRKMKTVDEVVDKNCRCQMCREKITLYKLYELYKLKDPRAFYFSTLHNIQFYSDLMKKIREAIESDKFSLLKEKYLKYY